MTTNCFSISDLLRVKEISLKSIAQSHRAELESTIELFVQELIIPKVQNKNSSISKIEQTQAVLYMFPNVVMNAKIHHGSIALTAGDLSTQNVDVVAVCSTSEVLLKNILDQAEAGPGNLNCKSISFVPWIITSNSISEFVSTSLNHPKKYRTVAFPALRYGLANCPTDVVAKAMIDAAISKIQKTTIHCTVSFIILPDQLSIHHEFANRLASIQKTSEPFGSIECSFSRKVTLTGENKSIEDADKHFLELTTRALKQAHLDIISRNILWKYQADGSTWESYSYRCNADIEYACGFNKTSMAKITNEQSETSDCSLPVRWQSQSTNCTRFPLDEYENIKEKFDQTMSDGTVYGHGVYFATNAKYSHDYTRSNQSIERCMFVVLILVGKSILGNTSMKVPPK
ncbi:unnamed protein product [Rotaria magnacalcarata]